MQNLIQFSSLGSFSLKRSIPKAPVYLIGVRVSTTKCGAKSFCVRINYEHDAADTKCSNERKMTFFIYVATFGEEQLGMAYSTGTSAFHSM